MEHHYFEALLQQWQNHAEKHHDSCQVKVAIPRHDLIRVQALAQLYKLDQQQIIADILKQSLNQIEASMPYRPGTNIIRYEEGDPVYEDVGMMPIYLKHKQQLQQHRKS